LLAACGDDDDMPADSGSTMDAATDDDSGDNPVGAACDLTGSWVSQHNTRNTALGAPQLATNWNYHRIEQTGDSFTIVASYDCGYVVRGTTDVSLSDATLEAMAQKSTAAVGTHGTFAPTEDGEGCDLRFDRIYNIRGANKARFLDDVWRVGDPPKPLDEFPLPTNEAEGMEDWDEDGHEGLTQLTGLGNRYHAQIDWSAFHGTVPQHASQFGGDGVLTVDYDVREVLSQETPVFLRTSSTPMSPGYGYMARFDDTTVTAGTDDALATCRAVQAAAVAAFGNPPTP
jgi:hypothetical protein